MHSLTLSDRELVGLRESQEALLSVLHRDDPVPWQLEVNDAVKRLIGADRSVFSIPEPAGGSLLVTDDTPADFERSFLEFIGEASDGALDIRDEAVQVAHSARISAGSGAYHMEELGPPGAWLRSPMYNDVFAPHGFPHMVGLSTPLLGSEATQFFGFTDRSAPGYGERGLKLLELLVPTFVSAVRIRHRTIRARGRFAALFDDLEQPIALYSKDGALLYRSRRLRALMDDHPQATDVLDAADALARSVAGRRRGGDAPCPAARPVPTPAGTWRVCAALTPAGMPGGAGVVALAEPMFPAMPDEETLRDRFGLTPRQAVVARLMGQGLGDQEIAERLTISWHTARRHARDVLRKLGLSSRAAVAMTLLGSPTS